MRLLKWDKYKNYDEIDSRLNYVWKVETAIIPSGDCLVKAKQNIQLYGHGLHRKHEVTIAFSLQWIEDVSIEHLSVEHPGAGSIPVPGMFQGDFPAYVRSPGRPTGIRLSFNTPVSARRWSCLPITASGIIDLEVSLFEITLWLPSAEIASFACDQILAAKDDCGQRANLSEQHTFNAPGFDDIPDVPPGIVRRDF